MLISKLTRILSCGILVFVTCTSTIAQDTITVQTFDWTSGDRSRVFEFPDDSSASYAKIIMEYNMRCHNAAVGSGNVGCREWDYSCNTFITDSSRTDSVRRLHPSHLISGFDDDVFPYSSSPLYMYTRHDRIATTIDSVVSATSHKVLSDMVDVEILNEDQASFMFILTSDELISGGLAPGGIVGMEMPFELGDFLSMSFRVRLQNTDRDNLDVYSPIEDNWSEVYFDQLEVNAPGMSELYFYEPFEWDGNSNVAVEIMFNDKLTPTGEMVRGESGANQAIFVNDQDHVFALNGSQYFQPDIRHMRGLENEITIMTWIFGDPFSLPANTYLLEGVDDDNNRQINLHLPWGNGQVYWDCGNDGSGYDRINKPANEADYEGRWNHWAFTKNASTGEMKIYLNGELWHSGTGKTKPIDLAKLNIGKGYNSDGTWAGWVNEMSIWKKELNQTQIEDVMRFQLDNSHPFYDDLLLHFNFEEKRGKKVTNVRNNQDYDVIGSPSWRKLRAEELYFNYRPLDERPAISFIQGELVVTNTSNPYIDSMMASPRWVRPFKVVAGDLVEDPSEFLWQAGYLPVYNDMMEMVDSVYAAPEDEIVISDLVYHEEFPAKFELLSLVTPYGNGLDLGQAGKTFTFDVTDFSPILKGKKRLSLEMGGQNQEEMDIKFHFIKGVPAREVIDIQNIWRFQRGNYGAIQNDDVFEPRTVQLHSDASHYKIRSSITGHGQNGEFQPRQHYVNVNGGAQDFTFDVWKECSTIPIYPQGGTWIFDRAGWCPGDPTLLFENDISNMVTPGGSVELDYGVNGAHMDAANYLVSQQLVSYGPLTRTVDAALENIVRPSRKVEWERENPSCNEPTVIIKNYGSDDLTSVEIEYGVVGGDLETFTWTGQLAFLGEATVVLPIMRDDFWSATVGEEGVFVARVLSANGVADDYSDNDEMYSPYDLPQLLPQPLQLEFATNSRGSETSYAIKNQAGEVLYEGSGFANNSKYVIDLDLAAGCYSLEFNDSGDDGLYYWYWEQTGQSRGRGYVKFNRVLGGRGVGIKGFEAEFGRFIHYDFGVQSITSNEDERVLRRLEVHPNPSSGQFRMDFYSEISRDLEVRVTDALGKTIFNRTYNANAGEEMNEWIDLSRHKNGMYFVTFTQADRTTTRTLILSK